jgi:hypothetical protein
LFRSSRLQQARHFGKQAVDLLRCMARENRHA